MHVFFSLRNSGSNLEPCAEVKLTLLFRFPTDFAFLLARLEGFPALSWRLCRLFYRRPIHRVSRLISAMSFGNIHTQAERSQGSGSMESLPTTARRKLEGRAFYESLGSPRLILAPMVDQSEFVSFFLLSLYRDQFD